MNRNTQPNFSFRYSITRSNFFIFLVSMLVLTGAFKQAQAQIPYNESFEHVIPGVDLNIPLGWWQEQIGVSVDVDNKFHCSNIATFPSITARTGTDFLAFNSKDVVTGESSFIATKRLDMRGGMPVGGASFNFWFFRDNVGMQASADRIQVYVNDSAHHSTGPTGSFLLSDIATGASVINRSCALAPAPATVNAWNQYSYTIPNSSPFNGSSVYVIIVATSSAGYNMFIDDFSVNTYPLNQTYTANSAEVVNQNVNTTAAGRPGDQIIGCRLTMDGAASPRVLTNMEFNTNGCTNPLTDLSNARLWFTGGSATFDTAHAILLGTYTNPHLTNYMFLTAPNANYSGMASFNGMEHGYNYFWITYRVAPTAVTGNFVDADWIGFTMSGAPQTPAVMTLPGSRLIWAPVTIPFYSSYCGGANSNRTCWINRVTLNGNLPAGTGINNTLNRITSGINAGPACPPPYPRNCAWQTHPADYEMFQPVPGKTTSLTADGTTVYTITVQVGSLSSGNFVAAWIDFNGDYVFTPNEKIAQSGNLGSMAIFNANFTVPDTARPGMALLRVREAITNTNTHPTATHVYGEAEDYLVTLIPDCPGMPGWTTWLGINDNWADPVNWCPSVVPILGSTDKNVRIPGGPTGVYTYFRPVIRDSVQARALKLRIEGTDTIHIDATRGSSLTVLDSIKIQNSTGAIIVNSAFSDSAQVYNSVLARPTDSPLSNAPRARSFLSFTQAELLATGMRAGDLINGIRIHIQRKSNGNPYKDFTVKYFYTTTPQALFGISSAANIPLPTGSPASPVTIFSGDLDPDSFVPVLNDFGTIVLPLSTPIVWSGTANPLIIEMCYDNTGFPVTGSSDEVRFTQTTSLRRYMTIENLSTYIKAGCSLTPKDTVISPSTGVMGSNLLTVSPVDAAEIFAGQLTSLGQQVVSVAGNVVTLSGNLAMNVNGNVIFFNAFTTSLNYRPNLTFEFSRPYNKFPINVAGHWHNNGTFIAGTSRVTFNGTLANLRVQGDSITTFYDLTINNTNHVWRATDFVVTDSLQLLNGRLKLNNGLVTLTNPSASALTRSNGTIQAETDLIANNLTPYGRFRWQMGAGTGMRVIPFISTSGDYIPLDYNMDSGTHDVIFSTYKTLQNNTNIPTPEVTNIFGVNNAAGGAGYGSAGWAMVDRYYMIDNTAGVSPQADITFRYAVGEQAQFGNVNMKAQRWMSVTDNWEFPFQPSQTFIGGAPNSVQLLNYAGFGSSTWWTIVGNSTPLPVSLLEFTAKKVDRQVKLSWSTASELDNSHFEIDRTTDNENFEFIDRVESYGPGNNLRKYETWDRNPVNGIQYYYLKQYDFNGNMEQYGPAFADFRDKMFEIVSASTSDSRDVLTVTFYYDSNEPYSYRIMDMTGRIIVAADRNTAVEGINVIDIDAKFAKGAYYILLQNSESVISRKFFY